MRKQPKLSDSGEALDEVTRGELEPLFGYELRDVRIHETRQAGELARRFEADAFTIGSDIFSSEGRLVSPMAESKGLLAHEITHVIQQTHPPPIAPALIGKESQTEFSHPEIEYVHAPQFAASDARSTDENPLPESMEAAAQAAEQEVSSTTKHEIAASPVDVEEIAEHVYRLMQQDLLLEKERARR